MCKICVFGGTSEGRLLSEFLTGAGADVTCCVATAYGGELLEPSDNLTVSAKRLPENEIEAMLTSERFDVVIDATHPYAAHITESIAEACNATNTGHIRLLRDAGGAVNDAVCVSSTAEAVEYLNNTQGNILLTTGSKELAVYSGIEGFAQRVYARVLPMADSLDSCVRAGLKPAHILAMQGPFSRELNIALLKSVNASYLVTKDGGNAGGFGDKAAAAAEAGATLVVIGRPEQREGLSFDEVISELSARFGLHKKSDVAVVGIGPGSEGAMTVEAREAIAAADCLIGARRMLEAVARPGQKCIDAISPRDIAGAIKENIACSCFAVVMSGDVGFFSGTKKLLPLIADCEVRIIPGLSSLVYLCSRLGASYEDVVPVSLHGRDRNIIGDIRRHRRIFVLTGGNDGVNRLCADLCDGGFGNVRVSVGQRLSYPDERITVGTAEELRDGVYPSLSAALIERDNDDAVVTPGLPDEAFLRSGEGEPVVPMTKSEVRAVCISKLALTRSAVCWDIGAGTGSVSVEMALQAYNGEVFAVERKSDAVELLNINKKRFALDNMTVVPGLAPEACAELPAPTHVFVGGSAGNMREIINLVLEKNPDARIVATAVTLESAAELTECLAEYKFEVGEVVCLNVSRGRKAGRYHLMTAQNPVYIFTMQRAGGRS